jgi:hypothetical protein
MSLDPDLMSLLLDAAERLRAYDLALLQPLPARLKRRASRP